MPDIALRPRSPTELVDAGFQLYRREAVHFIAGLALVYLPWFVIMATTRIAGLVTAGSAANAGGQMTAFDMTPLMYFALGNLIVQSLSIGITTVLANDVYFGRQPNIAKAARNAFFRSPAIFVAALIIVLPVSIGFMLLLIPGLYLLARWFAMPQAVVLEDHGPIGALGRSWALSSGHVRHIVNTMGLVILLQIAISYGGGFLSLLLPGQVLRLLLGVLISCVVQPLIGIVATLLYYDIRIRREGFDIEYLAAVAPRDEPSTVP
jgi:hypothetical protein